MSDPFFENNEAVLYRFTPTDKERLTWTWAEEYCVVQWSSAHLKCYGFLSGVWEARAYYAGHVLMHLLQERQVLAVKAQRAEADRDAVLATNIALWAAAEKAHGAENPNAEVTDEELLVLAAKVSALDEAPRTAVIGLVKALAEQNVYRAALVKIAAGFVEQPTIAAKEALGVGTTIWRTKVRAES